MLAGSSTSPVMQVSTKYKTYGAAPALLEETSKDTFEFTRNLTKLIREHPPITSNSNSQSNEVNHRIKEETPKPANTTESNKVVEITPTTTNKSPSPSEPAEPELQTLTIYQNTLGPLNKPPHSIHHHLQSIINNNIYDMISIHTDFAGHYSMLGITTTESQLQSPKMINGARMNHIYEICVGPFDLNEVEEFLVGRVRCHGGEAVVLVEDGGLAFTSFEKVKVYDFRQSPPIRIHDEIPAGCLVDVHFVDYKYSGRLGSDWKHPNKGPVLALNVHEVHLLEMPTHHDDEVVVVEEEGV
ncbi:hypothetical protein HDU76_007417 [Blyttiomyces sp. JEL0837]|nr:hypothetical protein HDU76_007417 [Blyttiomyces sp. JEL0837]